MKVECFHCGTVVEISGSGARNSTACPICGTELSPFVETAQNVNLEQGRFGRFELLELIGQGHFGRVWKARDVTLDRLVALKIPRTVAEDAATYQAFRREARAAAALQHPHIIRILDVAEHNGIPFIASEYVKGESLARRMSQSRYSLLDAVKLCRELASALHYAHERGVVHRDLKPGNILIDGAGQPHILDFGLARRAQDESVVLKDGAIQGTPAYMAPEQARGEVSRIDRRTDVYALGVVLYELLTGVRPFDPNSPAFFQQLLLERPAPPSTWNPNIPRAVEEICLKALEKLPDDRFPTAGAMAAALALCTSDAPTTFIAELTVSTKPPAKARSGFWITIAALLLLTAATGAARFFLPPLTGGVDPSAFSAVAQAALPAKVNIVLATDPPGARIVLYPLDFELGTPRLAEAVRPEERTPLELELTPGDYLVVAALDDGRFHEVFRRVPRSPTTLDTPYDHKRWRLLVGNKLRLAAIKIPDKTVAEGMARLEGSPRFVMGDKPEPSVGAHDVFVPPFLLDTHEVTYSQFRAAFFNQRPISNRGSPPPASEDLPVAGIAIDDAIAHAERVGKRLPTEVEYEFAATLGGTRRFPWGDDPTVITEWSFTKAGDPAFDRLPVEPPVYGLFSNVAEWTSTRFAPYPPQLELVPSLPLPSEGDYWGAFAVRGGDSQVVRGKPPTDFHERRFGPRLRNAVNPIGGDVHFVGFRCARSVKPRLSAADFETVLPINK
uniref:non-specific serine/threonine protein kinase n=1 Tax=Schlesneria paludicola TaxID=360056 RepID=A0A7C4QQB2_9PLAN